MPETLLRTKLFVPPLRPNLVPRPQLIDRLDQGLQLGHKLSLISAPAGFGKTTLVSEWVSHLRLDDDLENQVVNRIAWLSLDEGDNDPTRFLTYLVAALQTIVLNGAEGTTARHASVDTIGEGALVILQSAQPPPAETVLIALINDLTTISGRIILILDDYHVIDNKPAHASTSADGALAFLLEHLPPQVHLVIATREDPPLSLARLRARGQLSEVRAADLRFTLSEAAEFLNRVMGLDLSAEDIAALETRTEGWIAGLQLAAISLQGQANTSRVIQSFTGSNRLVLDYLIEEVLKQQAQNIQDFLLQTAILNRLTGSLCDAITGQEDGRSVLEMLDRANLFIVPLDEERRWYRYHHLFAGLLRRRLGQTQRDPVATLHRRASEWYMQNGFVDEAIEHVLRAKDFERAASLIEEQADAVWQGGEHAKLRRWLMRLSIELVCARPQLCIFQAWYLFAGGQQDAAERTLQAAEQALDGDPQRPDALTPSERAKLRGRSAAIRTFMASYQGDVPGIIQHARLALEYLPEQDTAWRSITAIVLGDAYGFQGDITAAYETRSEALRVCQAAGDTYYVMLASMKVAITLRSQGRLQQTVDICRQQVQLANESGLSHTGLNGILLLIWAEVLAELNDLDGAMVQAREGLELAESSVDLAMLGWGYMCWIRILFSSGELTGVQETIRKLTNMARESNMPPWIMNQVAAWQARLWLAQNKLPAVVRWLEKRGFNNGGEPIPLQAIDYFSLYDYLVLARVLITQERLDEATRLLEQLHKAAETGGRTSKVIEILLLQALAFQARGDTSQAMTSLERSLALAEPEDFSHIFVDEGRPMARLLHEALKRGTAPAYVGRLLAAFSSGQPAPVDAKPSLTDPPELIEPLSERELEVLQLVAEGLTNREIADRLYLSINTVKVHTRNVYGKLNVHSRTQALARSQELGLLSRKKD